MRSKKPNSRVQLPAAGSTPGTAPNGIASSPMGGPVAGPVARHQQVRATPKVGSVKASSVRGNAAPAAAATDPHVRVFPSAPRKPRVTPGTWLLSLTALCMLSAGALMTAGQEMVPSLAEYVAKLSELGVDGDAMLVGGVLLVGIAMVSRQLRVHTHTILSPGPVEDALAEVGADMAEFRNKLYEFQNDHMHFRTEIEHIKHEVQEHRKNDKSAEAKDAMFRLAGSLDTLHASLDKSLTATSRDTQSAVAELSDLVEASRDFLQECVEDSSRLEGLAESVAGSVAGSVTGSVSESLTRGLKRLSEEIEALASRPVLATTVPAEMQQIKLSEDSKNESEEGWGVQELLSDELQVEVSLDDDDDDEVEGGLGLLDYLDDEDEEDDEDDAEWEGYQTPELDESEESAAAETPRSEHAPNPREAAQTDSVTEPTADAPRQETARPAPTLRLGVTAPMTPTEKPHEGAPTPPPPGKPAVEPLRMGPSSHPLAPSTVDSTPPRPISPTGSPGTGDEGPPLSDGPSVIHLDEPPAPMPAPPAPRPASQLDQMESLLRKKQEHRGDDEK